MSSREFNLLIGEVAAVTFPIIEIDWELSYSPLSKSDLKWLKMEDIVW